MNIGGRNLEDSIGGVAKTPPEDFAVLQCHIYHRSYDGEEHDEQTKQVRTQGRGVEVDDLELTSGGNKNESDWASKSVKGVRVVEQNVMSLTVVMIITSNGRNIPFRGRKGDCQARAQSKLERTGERVRGERVVIRG